MRKNFKANNVFIFDFISDFKDNKNGKNEKNNNITKILKTNIKTLLKNLKKANIESKY